ncbi:MULTISPECIES: hypothetical protein [Parabacteroides]|jgi:hypothetical protein|uniref:Uncharacterized protein n=1 Tax=Parabacteroides segnis TaxID=2763058 RepID=A0ABR7E2C6_9BACT|nr:MULTISPECIES: hypothetical protein [Parabacteroides]MBC5643905.1 hypothetical protein [Parabacteroides segnis]MCM0711847.1 hypothetical protein [Parabacteroides sp. TA-V-105]
MKKLFLSILFCSLFMSVYGYTYQIRETASDSYTYRDSSIRTYTFFASGENKYRFTVDLNSNGAYPTNGKITDSFGNVLAPVTLYLNLENSTGKQYIGVISSGNIYGTIKYDVNTPIQIGTFNSIFVNMELFITISSQ